jgi:SAM-dependent methyltransferase
MVKHPWWMVHAGIGQIILYVVPFLLLGNHLMNTSGSFGTFLGMPRIAVRRAYHVLLVVTLLAGTLLVGRVVLQTILVPPGWDFQGLWLYGHVVDSGQNPYSPAAYHALAGPGPFAEGFREEVLDVGATYPPPSLLLFAAIGWLPLPVAIVPWMSVQIAAFVGMVVLLCRTFLPGQKWDGFALILTLSLLLPASIATFGHGQINFLAVLCVLAAWRSRDRAASGIYLVGATILKLLYGALWLYPVLRKRWRPLIGIAVAGVGAILASVAAFGSRIWAAYVFDNPVAHRMPARVFASYVNQSLMGESLRMFPNHMPAYGPSSHHPVYLASAAIVGLLTVLAVAWQPRTSQGEDTAFTLLILAGMLIYPWTLSNYYVLLLVPIGFLWMQRNRSPVGVFWTILLISSVYPITYFGHGRYSIVATLLFWGVIMSKALYQIRTERRIDTDVMPETEVVEGLAKLKTGGSDHRIQPETQVPRRLSILIPLYNEEEFIATLLDRVLSAPLPQGMDREVIVVDDASNDGSVEIADMFAQRYTGIVRLIRHSRNQGKGAAIRSAIEHATGEFSIIQDADLEYDPREYSHILKPLLDGNADAVYGSRFMITGERRVLYFWHAVGNRLLTTLCNMFADVNLTDMETCYKAFRTPLVQSIPLRSNRFGIEPELTIKLAQRQARIYEIPVSYYGRTYEEGKKIGFTDALAAFYVIIKTALLRDIYKDSGPETLDALAAAPRFNQWMADTIAPYVGQRVVEIGAGIGNLTRFLIARRKRYIATDINTEHLARLSGRFHRRPNMEIRYTDVANPGCFQDLAGQMDTIVCLNVLEHVEDDAAGLKNIHLMLSPGGHAIILVPHGQEIFGTLDTALGHHRRYSEAELREKMEAVGLHVERVIMFNRISRPLWYVSGRILKRKALSAAQMRLFDRFVWLWRKIDSRLPWRSTSLIAIGTRK